jgi:hypothetical protein
MVTRQQCAYRRRASGRARNHAQWRVGLFVTVLALAFAASAASICCVTSTKPSPPVAQQVDADHYTDMGKFPTAIGTRTGVWYEKRDRLYVAAPPTGMAGARLLVFEAQTD